VASVLAESGSLNAAKAAAIFQKPLSKHATHHSMLKLIFSLILLATSLRAESKTFHVFLVAGQSNAEGLNFTARDFKRGEVGRQPLEKMAEDEKVLLIGGGDIFNAESAMTMLKERGETYGPEIGLGRSLVAAGVTNVVIVKLAKGGTSLRQWLKGSPHDVKWADQTANLYENLIARTQHAITQLRAHDASMEVKLSGVFWMQGEADAFHSEALLYPERLQRLVNDLRRDLDAPELPFILGRTAITQPKSDDGLDMIRSAQMSVCDGTHPMFALKNAAWVDVDDIAQTPRGGSIEGVTLPMGGLIDPQHFTPHGYSILGARWANKWLQQSGFGFSRIKDQSMR
jgi:Carbohydrate esterase, sialic acid-specific acetylesterase